MDPSSPEPEMSEPDPRGPAVTIAHRAGNRRSVLTSAIRAGVDLIEADIWLHRGRLVARHAKALGPLPIHYDRWYVKPALRRLLTLDDLIHHTRGAGPRLFLDLKGQDPRIAQAVVETLRRHDALAGAGVCSQVWGPLDEIARLAPEVAVSYSVGYAEQLPRLWDRLRRDPDFHAVSINHRLLTRETVEEIKGYAVRVYAWTVDDPARAARLLAWGVDGITSNNLRLLTGLRSAAAQPATVAS